MRPDASRITHALAAADLGHLSVQDDSWALMVRVEPSETCRALEAVKGAGLDFLVDLFGVDTGEGIEVVYVLRSLTRDEDLVVKVGLPYEGTLESVWELFPSAGYPERETAELLGLSLSGHPNPKRLLTIDGVEPLLLKRVEIRTPEQARDRAGDEVGL